MNEAPYSNGSRNVIPTTPELIANGLDDDIKATARDVALRDLSGLLTDAGAPTVESDGSLTLG